jgi:hypothetical protein
MRLGLIRDWLMPEDGLAPVSRPALTGWLVFYALFFIHAATNTTGFLIIDHANLMFHEAGHAVFGWAGYYTQILGGTIGELLVPLLCTVVFIRRGETSAVVCCACWTFENFLYIAAYMADARRSALPLVGSDESDWTILFTHWGVLAHDTTIAAIVRGVGWMGMIAAVAWLAWRHLTSVDAVSPYRRSYTRT